MRSEDFSADNAPGRLVRHPVDQYWSFIPNPLPPALSFTPELVRDLSDADQALGQLAGVGRMLPNPHLLIRPFLRHEAVMSSQIEGTVARLEDLLRFEADPTQEERAPDVREVANYVAALDFGLQRLKTLPISKRFMREIHERLMKGVRGEDRRPGEFRQVQNFIGRKGQRPDDARFVPPLVPEMNAALDDLEKFISKPGPLPVLLQLALIHYQFETIHPFMDGNGRVGRLLISLLLCERACLPGPLLYLSAYFERNRDEYMDALLHVSRTGAWEDWLRFFLRGVAEQARDALQRSQRLLDLAQAYRMKLLAARSSALPLKLVEILFEKVAITISTAKELLGVSYRGAQMIVEKLQAVKIIREVTGKPRHRIYVAQEIVATLEGTLSLPQPKRQPRRRGKR